MAAPPNFEESQLTNRPQGFQKIVRKNGGIPKKRSSNRNFKGNDCCHKCGMPGHFIKDCPFLNAANNVVKQAFAAWGDFSSESEEEPDVGSSSMMVVQNGAKEFDSLFAVMAQPDEDDNDEVNFRDVQRNLKSYSSKKLMLLANILIDTYYSFVNDNDALIIELGYAEQSRDNLMVVVVDLKETIENLSKEKNTLVEKIAATKQERDDMVVSIEDLREQVEEVTREHNLLKKQTKNGWTTLRERKWLKRLNLSLRKNKVFVKKRRTDEESGSQKRKYVLPVWAERMKGSSQQWYMDNDCSKLMTGRTNDFLSLKAMQGGIVSLENGDLGCLSVVNDNAELWHRRLGHASFTLLNRLVKKDLVHGLLKSSFKDHRVCDACVKRKQVRSLFRPKKKVSILRPLDLLHMDLCGPMRLPSRGGKRTEDETPADIEELGSSIITSEVENRVVDAVHGTPAAKKFKPDQRQETHLPSQPFSLK
ncbi:uncharacterized protein [Nicotiana sylvestris]|uniref:uncharacterized protein n=1 Tax=Nicotiana sylvestris TaxID=4096 RepID=UPI00388CD04A